MGHLSAGIVWVDMTKNLSLPMQHVLQNSISQLCKFITDHSPWMKIISTYNDSKFQGFKISDEYLNGCTLDDEADRRN